MLQNIPLIALFGTTCFMMAAHSLWYSELLFGRLQGRGSVTRADIYTLPHLLLLALATAFVLALVYLAALLLALHAYPPTAAALGAWALMSVAVGGAALMEERPISHVLVASGFFAVLTGGGLAMMWYWPW